MDLHLRSFVLIPRRVFKSRLAKLSGVLGGCLAAAAVLRSGLTNVTDLTEIGCRRLVPSLSWCRPFLPLVIAISESSTRPLPGHQRVKFGGFDSVFGGGAVVRLTMQATDASRILNVGRITLVAKRQNVPSMTAFDDTVDPLAQSGFGKAEVQTFQVTIEDETRGSASYVTADGREEKANFPDLLPNTRAFHLDGHSGSQETLNVLVRLDASGIFELRFKAVIVVEGKEDEIETSKPIYIGKK